MQKTGTFRIFWRSIKSYLFISNISFQKLTVCAFELNVFRCEKKAFCLPNCVWARKKATQSCEVWMLRSSVEHSTERCVHWIFFYKGICSVVTHFINLPSPASHCHRKIHIQTPNSAKTYAAINFSREKSQPFHLWIHGESHSLCTFAYFSSQSMGANMIWVKIHMIQMTMKATKTTTKIYIDLFYLTFERFTSRQLS